MRLIRLLLLSSLCLCSAVSATTITGGGSTFIYPVMARWSQDYAKETKVQINYQPIGSGGGIQQLQNRTIEFAATDMPLSTAELDKHHWVQFPMISGGIVPIVNIADVEKNQLVLSGPILANIYLGHITFWDDQTITKQNPGLHLPHAQIITIHRADGSGTTFNFTHYLAQVNSEWQQKVGANTLVSWPHFGLGAQGNAGVASQVKQTPNSIGYVEYAYAKQNQIAYTKMLNKEGNVVSPELSTFSAATTQANWQDHDNLTLTNQPGTNSWPLLATTFILLPEDIDPTTFTTLLNFFTWAFHDESNIAEKLDYVSLPESIYTPILKLIQQSQPGKL